jgi:leader peptidase (prepilin peptidase)/N-methyltransferase
LITACSLTALLCAVPTDYFLAYFVFISALIVTIRSDLETMLISRLVTLFLIPLGVIFSALGLLPISPFDSIAGTLLGYGSLWLTATVFYWCTKKEGIGQGDFELLAFIGSFTGLLGCWMTLLIGSVAGSVVGIMYLCLSKKGRETRIPFGPFLAVGAIVYILAQEWVARLFLTFE